MLVFALRNDHRCPFVDGVPDKLVPIGFLAPQRHEHGVPLHSPRVIRDVFHRAINWPEDLANWSRSEKGLELHEALTSPTGDGLATANPGEALNSRMYFGVNVAHHRLGRFVPPARSCGVALPALVFRLAEWESLCESPHAAQDQGSGRPFRQRGKI